MNRELKFRAWDDLNKKWLMGYDVGTLGGFSLTGECVLFSEWSACFDLFIFCKGGRKPDHLIIDQFTSLKDKKGKDIYEGDICILEDEKFKTVFKGMGFWFQNSEEDLYVFDANAYQLEVIGNIHQNPELL